MNNKIEWKEILVEDSFVAPCPTSALKYGAAPIQMRKSGCYKHEMLGGRWLYMRQEQNKPNFSWHFRAISRWNEKDGMRRMVGCG